MGFVLGIWKCTKKGRFWKCDIKRPLRCSEESSQELTKSSLSPPKMCREWWEKKNRTCNTGERTRTERSETCVWQHVCDLLWSHFVVPWTYRLLRSSPRKIKMISGSVLHYWSYSLHPSQASYSAAPRCGCTPHSSLCSVKPRVLATEEPLCGPRKTFLNVITNEP